MMKCSVNYQRQQRESKSTASLSFDQESPWWSTLTPRGLVGPLTLLISSTMYELNCHQNSHYHLFETARNKITFFAGVCALLCEHITL